MSEETKDFAGSYYRAESGFEAHRVIEAWQLTFNLGCVLKYVCRAGLKPSAAATNDIDKALDYIDFELDFYSRIMSGEEQVFPFEAGFRLSSKSAVRSPSHIDVGEAWGLDSLKIDVLRLISSASMRHIAGDYIGATRALEDLIPLVLEVKASVQV